MDIFDIMARGEFDFLGDSALPSLSSAATPFSDAPQGAVIAIVTLRTAGVTYRYSGDASAGANGHDLGLSASPHAIVCATTPDLKAISMIQNGGTATGFVSYWGRRSS